MTYLASQTAYNRRHPDKGRDHAVPPRPVARYSAPIDQDALAAAMMAEASTIPQPKPCNRAATDKVVQLLMRHGELTVADIANKTGKAPGAVRLRLKRLKAEGIVAMSRRQETDIWRMADAQYRGVK